MSAFEYSRWDGTETFKPQSADQVFDQFSQYLMDYGEEMLQQLEHLQESHPDIVDMLIKRGYVEQDREGRFFVTPRGIRRVENTALEELFDVRRRDQLGRHDTDFRGPGQAVHEESKPYEYGDPVSNLNLHETLKNALHRTIQSPVSNVRSAAEVRDQSSESGGLRSTPDAATFTSPLSTFNAELSITEDDLVIHDTEYQTSCATVVLLDMSGSMMRYGKFAGAKRVALALQALVRTRYQGDFLQFVGFYTYATPLSERQLVYAAPKPVSLYDSMVRLRISLDNPPAFVPEHFTNIHAGLQFARRILHRHPARNKQIIVITDGEPTAHVEGRDVLLIYPPAEKTARITLAEAKRCADEGLNIASFALIEDYFYFGLVNFVEQMAHVTGGVSATCNAQDMGNMVIDSFVGGRRVRRHL